MGFFSDLFGGDSNSGNSSTSNKTDNIDQKLQMAAGSVGATASGGGMVNINTSDMGAVASSFTFANGVSDGAFKVVNATADGAFKASNAATDSALKFANASSDSSFKFADSALADNALITSGALGFAQSNSDGAFKLVNATTDSAFKAIDASVTASAKAQAETAANAMKLANAATDSALRFGDSTVAQSFDFAKVITAGAAHEVAAAGSRSDAMVTSALSAVQQAYAGTSATLADAYTNSKAGEQKVMVAAALAILGMVAVKIMR
jgi:hypothetical protein